MFGKKKKPEEVPVVPVQPQPVQPIQPQKVEEVEEVEETEEEETETKEDLKEEISEDELIAAMQNLSMRIARIEHFLRLDF